MDTTLPPPPAGSAEVALCLLLRSRKICDTLPMRAGVCLSVHDVPHNLLAADSYDLYARIQNAQFKLAVRASPPPLSPQSGIGRPNYLITDWHDAQPDMPSREMSSSYMPAYIGCQWERDRGRGRKKKSFAGTDTASLSPVHAHFVFCPSFFSTPPNSRGNSLSLFHITWDRFRDDSICEVRVL